MVAHTVGKSDSNLVTALNRSNNNRSNTKTVCTVVAVGTVVTVVTYNLAKILPGVAVVGRNIEVTVILDLKDVVAIALVVCVSTELIDTDRMSVIHIAVSILSEYYKLKGNYHIGVSCNELGSEVDTAVKVTNNLCDLLKGHSKTLLAHKLSSGLHDEEAFAIVKNYVLEGNGYPVIAPFIVLTCKIAVSVAVCVKYYVRIIKTLDGNDVVNVVVTVCVKKSLDVLLSEVLPALNLEVKSEGKLGINNSVSDVDNICLGKLYSLRIIELIDTDRMSVNHIVVSILSEYYKLKGNYHIGVSCNELGSEVDTAVKVTNNLCDLLKGHSKTLLAHKLSSGLHDEEAFAIVKNYVLEGNGYPVIAPFIVLTCKIAVSVAVCVKYYVRIIKTLDGNDVVNVVVTVCVKKSVDVLLSEALPPLNLEVKSEGKLGINSSVSDVGNLCLGKLYSIRIFELIDTKRVSVNHIVVSILGEYYKLKGNYHIGVSCKELGSEVDTAVEVNNDLCDLFKSHSETTLAKHSACSLHDVKALAIVESNILKGNGYPVYAPSIVLTCKIAVSSVAVCVEYSLGVSKTLNSKHIVNIVLAVSIEECLNVLIGEILITLDSEIKCVSKGGIVFGKAIRNVDNLSLGEEALVCSVLSACGNSHKSYKCSENEQSNKKLAKVFHYFLLL